MASEWPCESRPSMVAPRLYREPRLGRPVSMRFQYQLVAEDHGAFITDLYGTGGRVHKKVRQMRITVVLVLLLVASSAILSGTLSGGDGFVLAAGIGWFFWLPRWYTRGLSKGMRDAATTEMAPGSVGFHELIVDEDGVTERTPFGADLRYWNGIQRVSETPDHLFIYYGQQAAFIVPTEWLGDSRDLLREALARRGASVAPAIVR